MSWASHDSIQCRRPASGATTASSTSKRPKGSPVLTCLHDERAQHADADQGDARARRRGRTWPRAARDSPARGPSSTRISRGQPMPSARRIALGARRRAQPPRLTLDPAGVLVRLRLPADRPAGRRRSGPRAVLCLRGHQPVIRAATGHQLGVRARLRDAPVVEGEDAVGADHARQPMREDQRRAPLHQPVERLLDHRLALRVHRRERLVQDQDGRVPQERPRDGDALALAAGEPDAALAHHGLVAPGQAVAMNSSALAARAAAASSSGVASGLPMRRLSSTVPWKR